MSENASLYKVVTNHAKQYYIWPADADPPPGWRDAGCTGTKAECLSYIVEVWAEARLPDPANKIEEGKM
jgi:MbtH protein